MVTHEPDSKQQIDDNETCEKDCSRDIRSLFSKRKIRPSPVHSLPPPPPPPVPKVASDPSSSLDDGWEREYVKLDTSLRERGLRIEKVDADGSCLFSSFAFHLPGSTSESLRNEAVDFMLSHADDFAPFIDSEAYPNGFDDYCLRMRRAGTWGGQLEIQALSLSKMINVYVFQTGDKSTIKMINFDEKSTQCITVSYHDGEHYNAVGRTEGDAVLSVDWLEAQLSTTDAPTYVDSNASAKPQRNRKKASLFN